MLVLLFAMNGSAATVTLTMDEVAPRPVNGLVINKGGITFTFANAGGNATYNTPIGTALTFLQDPVIDSPDEPFSVVFSLPVNSVTFGMAAARDLPATPIATISLFNGSTLIATSPLNSTLTDPFAEGQFTYSSTTTPVTKIVITPGTSGFSDVAFDNLTVTTTAVPTSVPTLSWTGIGVLCAALVLSGCFSIWMQRRRGQTS